LGHVKTLNGLGNQLGIECAQAQAQGRMGMGVLWEEGIMEGFAVDAS